MGKGADIGVLNDLTYWLETGSDGIDAFDFQKSPAEYIPCAAQTAVSRLRLS